MRFSIFFFSGDEGAFPGDKYRLVMEGARLADRHGFEAIWTPERHFHVFGGLYPNPAVLAAAIAAVTERVQIRAGSIILPVHDPVRVVEEWSVVDNLSRGRAGLALAAGFHPNDFVFFPENWEARRQLVLSMAETLQRLWRGETLRRPDGSGREIDLTCYPRPVQPSLPLWLTTGSSDEVFLQAGKLGLNVLTALLILDVAELEPKIALYRRSLADHGHDPASGRVTCMLHTYLGEDLESVRETVRQPFYQYLRTHKELTRSLTRSIDVGVDFDKLSPRDEEALFKFGFDRYFDRSSLMGTPESCGRMIERLRAIGVDEAACLVDFGLDVPTTLEGLRHLAALKDSLAKG